MLEWEWPWAARLPQGQGCTSSLGPRLFNCMTNLHTRPSNAADEITTHKEALSYLGSIYLETLFQPLPS